MDVIGIYGQILEWSVVVIALVILVSGLDDLFIDAYYWIRQAYRGLVVRPRHPPLELAALQQPPEKLMAMMIPAWQESGVIARMVENAVATLEYGPVEIFVGTYQNDPDTIHEVDRLALRMRNVHRVTVPVDGPTCKADCLNWVIKAIFEYEREHGVQFAGVVLHDSEDVVHPLEMKLFNYLLPRKDFIQLPVLSLERPWNDLVAGTYIDDFAEWHSKDLVVRESLAGDVPCAGVSACFSRKALVAMISDDGEMPFNTATLTEDYDIGLRMRKHGLKSVFVKFPVEHWVRRKTLFGEERRVKVRSLIATREFFPATFRQSYRQKARWQLGIAIQGWEQIGWPGSLASKYLLFRDRKGLVTSAIVVLAYLLLFNFVGLLAVAHFTGQDWRPDFMRWGQWVPVLFAINLFLMLNRVLQRVWFVSRLYGLLQGLMSIPRMIVGNFINFFASMRAIRLYIGSKLFGTKIAWDKTNHVFPSPETLMLHRKSLGELLLNWRALDDTQLESALQEQARTGQHLGHIIIRQGVMSDEVLAEAIAEQQGLQRAQIAPEDVSVHGVRLPLRFSVQNKMVAYGKKTDGRTLVAVLAQPMPEVLAQLERLLPDGFELRIAKESELVGMIRGMTTPDDHVQPADKRLLGDVLIDAGYIRRNALQEAMTGYDPGHHKGLGHYLVDMKAITEDQLASALATQMQGA